MASVDRKVRLFEDILRLRRAGRELPGNRDIAEVRAALERELGPSVSRRLAGRLLGVSHTSLGRWIEPGDLPTVYTPAGRQEIPVATVLDFRDRVDAERSAGRRTRHLLEPAITDARRRAAQLAPSELIADVADRGGGHDRAERRALAYHRALARRLSQTTVDEARHVLLRWREDGHIDPRYADRWEQALERPLAEIRRLIAEDSEAARDLRQNSPFAGMLSEAERRRIVQGVH
jgi:hypothetical protein